MPGSREIKQRIKSAKNISKITKAMEMVSASKMRRSQQQAESSRPYARTLHSVLSKISGYTDSQLHPLLQTKSTGSTLLVLFSTDRGLCGGLNGTMFKAAFEWSRQFDNLQVITIGKKAKQYCRIMGWNIYAEFAGFPDKVTYADTLPISGLLMNGFLQGDFCEVYTLHMQSLSTLTQQPMFTHLLPISPQEIQDPSQQISSVSEYTFEPDPITVLNWLLPYYTENEIYFMTLESKASEHSARMMAMKNASDNANEIVKVLNLEYNRTRQAHITQELQEITTAQLALA